jgi:hypothetical protein
MPWATVMVSTKDQREVKMAEMLKNEQTFVEGGVIFTVGQADDGKFVADIALDRGLIPVTDIESWARVVGRFNSMGDAITAAKHEIEKLIG